MSTARQIGYARVSTDQQGTDPQTDALRAAGCVEIVEEQAPGADRSRPVLAALLGRIATGETLVVVRLDRLARSVAHLLAVIEQLEARGAYFRSLRDPIDTTTPQRRRPARWRAGVAPMVGRNSILGCRRCGGCAPSSPGAMWCGC